MGLRTQEGWRRDQVSAGGQGSARHLRRTISAMIWRHDNGAKWRSLPEALGPWWMAAQTFDPAGRGWACGAPAVAGSGEGASRWG